MKAEVFVLLIFHSEICFSLFINSARSNKQDGKIIGGKEILLSETPYQVSIRNMINHQCGGAIISNKHVISAAHCVILNAPRDLVVRLGSKYRESGGELVRVKTIFVHPNYNPQTYNNDFSLIELSRTVQLIQGVKEIIKLPKTNEPIADGTLTLVSGWGKTTSNSNSNRLSDVLMGVVLPIVNSNKCKGVYSDLTDKMICAGYDEGGKDSCQGDSGGEHHCFEVLSCFLKSVFRSNEENKRQYFDWHCFKWSRMCIERLCWSLFKCGSSRCLGCKNC
jgi:secreted trypsin-like serine protease